MCKAYLVPGSHEVRVHVETRGKGADCPVFVAHGGVAVIQAPIDQDIRCDILNTAGLLQVIRSYLPEVRCVKLSES